MVTADDRVKVLDFGLAKLLESQPVDVGATATAAEPLTEPGSIVGTLPYMSPEQVQGEPVDHRSDIFSLGVILYELTTGRRPFTGDTSALLLSSILKDTPPLASAVSSGVPRDLARIIRHSLAKDPAQRYQTAIDLRSELTELQQDLSSGSLQTPDILPRSGSTSWRWVAALVAVCAAVAGYAAWRSWAPAVRSVTPLNITFEQLTSQAGIQRYPSLSPDGKWVVYEGNQEGNADIYLQSVGGQNPINLTKDSPDDDTQPAFSSDGESIAFRSHRQGGGIFVMGRTGESVRRLTDSGFNPAWSPDGTTIVYATDNNTVLGRSFFSELWTVVVATGERRRIFEGDAVQPSWSPHGLRIAYWKAYGERLGQRDIWTIPAAGGPAVPVTSDPPVDWSPVWSPDGRFLFFSSDRGGPMNLWRVPIDERTGATLGPPEPLSAPASAAGLMSISANGNLVAYTSFASGATIQSVAFDPMTRSTSGAPVTVIGGSRPFDAVSPSPDGRWIAFHSLAPQLDIFVSRSDGTGVRQLTNDRANDKFPVWSPDGQQIAFMSNRDGKNQVWSINPDGSGLRRLTEARTGAMSGINWSPDGSKMTFNLPELGASKIFVFDPRLAWNEQTPTTIPGSVQPGIAFADRSWSPDGQQLAGTAMPVGGYRTGFGLRFPTGPVIIYSLATGRFTRLYESDSASGPLWLNDGRRLLFQEKSKLFLIDSQTRATRELMSFPSDTMDLSALTRDNRTIYFVRRVEHANVWLMKVN